MLFGIPLNKSLWSPFHNVFGRHWYAILVFNRKISRVPPRRVAASYWSIFSRSYPIEYKTGIVCYKCEIRRNGPRDRGSRNGSRIRFTVCSYFVGSCCRSRSPILVAKHVFAPRAALCEILIHDRIIIDKRAEFLLKCTKQHGRLIQKQIDIESSGC